jgi:hypothetical protein
MSMSPVKNRVGVGVESYVVFDAAGENGEGDLYVGSASGGRVFRVTFSRVHESSPALSPNGLMLAFIRGPHASDSTSHRVWIMNLVNGAEREVPTLGTNAFPRRLAWSLDGSTLYVRTGVGDFQVPGPPADLIPQPVARTEQASADTVLAVPLGSPVLAMAEACDSGVCARTASGTQVLSLTGRSPFRWGTDSVGYLSGTEIEVRPLGGGTTRQLRWVGIPSNVKTATHFPGAAVAE